MYQITSKILWSSNQVIDLGVCPYDITQRNHGQSITTDVYLNGSFKIPDDNKKFVFHDNQDAHWIEFSNRPYNSIYEPYDSEDEDESDYPHIYRTTVHIPYALIPSYFIEKKLSLMIKLPKSEFMNRLGSFKVDNSFGTHVEFIISNYGINPTTRKKFFVMDSVKFYTISHDNDKYISNITIGDRVW